MESKNKAEGVERLADIENKRHFLGSRKRELLLGEMIFPELIAQFELR